LSNAPVLKLHQGCLQLRRGGHAAHAAPVGGGAVAGGRVGRRMQRQRARVQRHQQRPLRRRAAREQPLLQQRGAGGPPRGGEQPAGACARHGRSGVVATHDVCAVPSP